MRRNARIGLVSRLCGWVLLIVGCGGGGATTPGSIATCPSAIPWSDAKNHIGSHATIVGPVIQTNYASSTSGAPTFLDVGKASPDPARVEVEIWGWSRSRFPTPPEAEYANKTICVTGSIDLDRSSARIIVLDPSSIVVAP
jgi:hypothetical protein